MRIDIHIDISLKHIVQKLFRGYSDVELCDLGDMLYRWLYPRFKAYRSMKRHGIPMGYTWRTWEAFLRTSQKAIENYLWLNDHRGFKKPLHYDYKQIDAACKELLANIDVLWN